MKSLEIPMDIVNELLVYDNGKLYRKIAGKLRKVNNPKDQKRYAQVWLQDKLYYAHRIVWAMFNNGCSPNLVIDHINRDPHDNRIENLRLVEVSDNNRNLPVHRNGKTPCISLTDSSTWSVQIYKGDKCFSLGRFDSEEAAKAALQAGRTMLDNGEYDELASSAVKDRRDFLFQ